MTPDLSKTILVAICIAAVTTLAAFKLIPGEAVIMAVGAVLGNAAPGLLGPSKQAPKE